MNLTDSPESISSFEDFIVIDARGHKCPVPTLKLRRHLNEMPDESGYILWANDPMAQIDIPFFCNENRLILISTKVEDKNFMFAITRAEP